MIFPPFFNPGSFSGETEVKVVIHLSQRLGSYLGYKVQSAYLNLQFAKNANCFSRAFNYSNAINYSKILQNAKRQILLFEQRILRDC